MGIASTALLLHHIHTKMFVQHSNTCTKAVGEIRMLSTPSSPARLKTSSPKYNMSILGGNLVPNVTIQCTGNKSKLSGPLLFSKTSFVSSTNQTEQCTLTGNLTIIGCNLLEWRADILNNCNQLNALAIIDSYVPAIEDIPRLPSLTNLTVSSTAWTGVWSEMPSGLARVDLSPFLQPQITCLNFNGNSLDDQDILSTLAS